MTDLKCTFKKTHDNAILPRRNNSSAKDEFGNLLKVGDSGYDLFAVEDVVIPASSVASHVDNGTIPMIEEDFECSDKIKIGSAIVPIGLQLAYISPGYWFRIEARSGLGFKYGIQPHAGIVDNMYRGDTSVKLYNLTNVDYLVKAGDRIAQIIFYPLLEAQIEFADEISTTKRGEKGFGSSGK